jgi:hypothetical protein
MLPSHTFLFDLSLGKHILSQDEFQSGPKLLDKLFEAFKKNEWIHVEIKIMYPDTSFNLYFKEENNVDHIRFTNPYRKRKLDELEHTNNSLSQFQPLLKKQRLLDVEVLDTELEEEELQHRMSLLLLLLLLLFV